MSDDFIPVEVELGTSVATTSNPRLRVLEAWEHPTRPGHVVVLRQFGKRTFAAHWMKPKTATGGSVSEYHRTVQKARSKMHRWMRNEYRKEQERQCREILNA